MQVQRSQGKHLTQKVDESLKRVNVTVHLPRRTDEIHALPRKRSLGEHHGKYARGAAIQLHLSRPQRNSSCL